ncbi:MAG: helix-turn-helix transcriptional regulator, partial [Candidatus Aminicenantes bacterium]|nr:helix-turn-helix transcriptional regulator [Candidatus Aminicenantes bacterium]
RSKSLFGEFFKNKRIEKGWTLRKFCELNGFDPGNISKIERGMLPPPTSGEKLERYALSLGLKRGSNDWLEFFDLAAASKGKIPADFLDDSDLVKKLPLIFRTIRGKKVSSKKLDDLIETIRKA